MAGRKKTIPSGLQTSIGGGQLYRLPHTYQIFKEADPETKRIYGTLAHVSVEDRKAIMQTGFGEMQSHIDYIEKKLKEF